jgi:cation diffusion facilitator family transporter
MIFTVAINIVVNIYEKRKGKELKSDFLLSDATHTLSDVFVSFSVIGTLLAVKLGYIWVDTAVSVGIAVLICRAGVEIIKKGTDILCDAVVIDPKKISEVACGFGEVASCHAVRSHGLSDDAHIDLHITVRRESMNLDEVHRLVHSIESSIKSAYPGVADVSIHVDPPNDEC